MFVIWNGVDVAPPLVLDKGDEVVLVSWSHIHTEDAVLHTGNQRIRTPTYTIASNSLTDKLSAEL